MDQTIRVNPTVMGGDPNRTQMAQPTVMGYPGSPNLGGEGGGPSLALNVRVSNRYAFAGDRTRAHVLTQISAGGAGGFVPGGKRLPVNVCLVIDRSGSMDGSPIQYVKKQHIQRIVAGTTTNLFEGLYAGGSQVASVPMAGYITRVLLLTDGEPTAGLKDFQSIVQQVADLKARGITVTALGFGPEYNEELMAGIARRSGGNYYYIERPEQIPEVFQKEMLTILGVTAKNIRLTFTLPRGVTVRQCARSDECHSQRRTRGAE